MEVPVFGIRITPPSGGVMGVDPVSVSAIVEEPPPPPPPVSEGIGGIDPIQGMTATGNRGQIIAIDGIPVSALRLGTTIFPNPPKYAASPASYADNFDLNQVASGDDQPYVDVVFGEGVIGVYLIENQGNDSGFMQALDATGNPVGPVVPFTTSDYLQTSYRTANNQIASGLFVWMEVPVFGIRITPPSGGVMGVDPVSVSAIVEESPVPGAGLTGLPDFSEFWNGETLVWEKALFTDTGVAGSTGIPFGLALPAGYSPGGGQQYPLVIYLHGADARGNDDNKNLLRQTARFFAHQALTVPAFNAFVLSPQVPIGQRFVNVNFDHGPYEQSASTLTVSMQLTENLIRYLADPAQEAALSSVLGLSAADVDTARLYVVGDSMGAYGIWDTLGRGAIDYAAAIASAGSGPWNRVEQIQETPLWVIHGEVDAIVPNYVPHLGDPDGAGSLGMLGLIDPAFDSTASTALIRLDDYATATDDPTPADTLIYSQYPGQFDHAAVAVNWTASMASDFSTWLFGHSTAGAEPSLQLAAALQAPRLEMVSDSSGRGWLLVWPESNWVLQEAPGIDAPWTDVSPVVSSPYPVAMGGDHRFFRLREADAE
jgi:dienelactone hydrolase